MTALSSKYFRKAFYSLSGFYKIYSVSFEIHELFDIANRSHKHLKFTYEISTDSIAFLDTLIYKGDRFDLNHILDIKTFLKKTETFQYLERSSCHPNSTFKAFIKGETIRHMRNTSNAQDLKTNY